MNGNIKRPLKAPTEPITDFATLQPFLEVGGLYASDKEDGIRCLIHPQYGAVSQKMLPIPNVWVQTILEKHCPTYLDGELIAIDCEGNDCDFNDTQSAIMSEDGQPEFEFRVFDWFGNQYEPYSVRRLEACRLALHVATDGCIKFLPQTPCRSIHEIEQREEDALARGKEGLMLRQMKGWYKEGRSTFNEGYLLKVKRFMDDEAKVIDIEQEMKNCNPATRDTGGLQKRTKLQAFLQPKYAVGKLLCMWQGQIIKIGSGFTGDQKRQWWEKPSLIVGKSISFRYQRHGMKNLPRCPVFKGIRYD